MGKWKLNMLRGSGVPWNLDLFNQSWGSRYLSFYNMEEDPGETTNLYFEHS